MDRKRRWWMRAKLNAIPWKHLVYTGATLATFLLAAGAKFKNS
jgi:hypothetical protein